MTAVRLKLLANGLAAVSLMGIGFAAAWCWQANAYGTVIATNEANRHADLTMIANAAATQARQALAKQQEAESRAAASDARYTREKADDMATNEYLRRAVADGNRRLRIAGSCSPGGGNVSGTTSAAGLGDAGSVELAAAVGRNIFDIRAGIIADQAALKAAQSYIRDVCR
ncbi:lysis protein [Pseudomonas sp. NPDC087358]|uniref:lysis protein n=1 Tax=Pseudomonas sp. NPDC087358 TaxID=3364439 RepID=UPI00384EF92B